MTEHVNSYYAASIDSSLEWPALEGEYQADVCVVGAGYTGLSTALHLAQRGYSVVVLEAAKVGWGASGRNGGHVGVGQRRGQEHLERKLGRETAHDLWSMSIEAVELVKHLIVEHAINCDTKQGILHVANKPEHAEHQRRECALLQLDYDYTALRYVEADELVSMIGSHRYHGGQLDSGSLHLHPLKYALGLAQAAQRAGARICEHSRVVKYRRGEGIVVSTAQGSVSCQQLVLACNGYLDGLAPALAGRIMPINNFILATEPLQEEQARRLIRDDVAVQDSQFVVNYWRLSADNRLVFGGGENYSKRFPADLKSFVRKYMLRVYPQLIEAQIAYAWGGTLAITLNRLPQFGRLEPDVYYAQGYSGHGIATATLGGKILAEAIDDYGDRFELLAGLPAPHFPGGRLLRWPALAGGMLYYKLRDRL